MSGVPRPVVDLGGPEPLDVVNARRGSWWRLVMEFVPEEGDDDVDFATVTSAHLTILSTPPVQIVGDISLLAGSNILSFELGPELSIDVQRGRHPWEMEVRASTDVLDKWAPLGGEDCTWQVVGRIVPEGS